MTPLSTETKVCTDCGGTGVVGYDDAHGIPRSAPCPCTYPRTSNPDLDLAWRTFLTNSTVDRTAWEAFVAAWHARGAVETTAEPDFQGLLREMWRFWGRPREPEFIDAGVSVAYGLDLFYRVSAALGDPVCADCSRRFSQHTTVITHDFRHRPALKTNEPLAEAVRASEAVGGYDLDATDGRES